MKLNKMTSYGIRIIHCIAEKEGNTVTSKYITEKKNIAQGVLMKVLRMLKEGGLVVSHQGRGDITGGYSLARPADEISVYSVIEAMEGGVDLYPLVDEKAYDEDNLRIYEELKTANQEYKAQLKKIRISVIL